MKKHVALAVLCTLVMIIFGHTGIAQPGKLHKGPIVKPPATQTEKQKPYYGPKESIIGDFDKQTPGLSFNMESSSETAYELGYVFQSSKKGQVTGLSVRMPRDGMAKGPEFTYTVSLWDHDTQQLLARTNITTTDIRFTAKALDTPVAITANKKYVVSVFIKPVDHPTQTKWSYYSMLKPGSNNTAAAYIPFTVGSLSLLNTQSILTNTPVFPATTGYHKDIVTGLPDIVFVAREK